MLRPNVRFGQDRGYLKREFDFTTVEDHDVVVDFAGGIASPDLVLRPMSDNVLYLNMKCNWDKGFPSDIIAELIQLRVTTTFSYDWNRVECQCAVAMASGSGAACFIEGQKFITEEPTYMLSSIRRSDADRINSERLLSLVMYLAERDLFPEFTTHFLTNEDVSAAAIAWTNVPRELREDLSKRIYGM
jgi:hypothetical protein